jgi:hypothetical protein
MARGQRRRDDTGMHKRTAAFALLLAMTSCSSMRYDLEGVGIPVHANAYGEGEDFVLKSKYVMYVHGLLGEKQPMVAEILKQHCGDAMAVTNFRVSAGANLWDWLGTHLSLGLIRLKTVTIRGRVVR